MSGRLWLRTAVLAVPLLVAGPALADKKPAAKEAISFGQLQAPTTEAARATDDLHARDRTVSLRASVAPRR